MALLEVRRLWLLERRLCLVWLLLDRTREMRRKMSRRRATETRRGSNSGVDSRMTS
jgi:hypothetical protein